VRKEQYIEKEIVKLLQYWSGVASIAGAIAILLLSPLDYFVTPENFYRFFIYRIITATLFIIIFFLTRIHGSKRYLMSLFVIASIIVSAMIEFMIFSHGGHQSGYFVGFIIVFMLSLGFLPLFSVAMASILAITIYFIYVIPLLLFDQITNLPIFLNNNVFLLATASTAIAWRYYNDNIFAQKLSLEYELSQEKEQLKQYSTQLEELVAQRTKELAVSEQKFRGLFDNAGDGVAVYDSSGIIVNVNRRFCELHGFPVESLVGTSIKVLDAGKDDAEKEERIRRILNGESLIYEARHYRKDGETVLFEISAKALQIDGNIYIQAFHRDVSDKKRLQEQLFQSQKMESIGMLAGGLAHDFNNVVSAIMGHVELLSDNDRLDADARKHLAIVETSSRRAGQMIAKLLKFARKGSIEVQPVDLNAVVRDTTELIGKTLSHKNVTVDLKIDDAVPQLMGDANQMEQVVMNLMVNAADAMPAGGTVTVATTAKTFGHEAENIHPLLAPGSYVILRVTDSGAGISDDVRDKIFDPFFTTKDKGKGTGLGLAMVYSIVKEHKGAVTVESQLGKWTTFRVYIPSAPAQQVVRPMFHETHQPAAGSVLIVEDEVDTLSFVRETIESFGYTVLSEDNAIRAMQIFREKADEIALVISDIFMPGIDGRDLIKNFKSIKPSVKVIAMSAYEIEDFVRKDIPVDDFLRKPFGGIELMSKVNKLIRPYKSLLS